MSESDVTRQGIQGQRPGREAPVDYSTRRRRPGRRRGEQPTVPDAEFRSYYGMPVLNGPVWKTGDIAGYFFLGGLAGASSVMAALAGATRQRELARTAKVGASGAALLSLAALVHDLGKPERFLNMLRVFKPTSPMSVGSWLLAAYAPASVVSAWSDTTGRLRPVGVMATGSAALLGPAVASYTAALISDTAVPAWHNGYREMPYVFVGSAATAAGGLGLLAAPRSQHGLPRRAATLGALTELTASQLMQRQRLGELVAEPYHQGKAGTVIRAGQALTATGLVLSQVAPRLSGRKSRALSGMAGVAMLAASAATRFGIFDAGIQSAADPRYVVQPQRQRVEREGSAKTSR